jgi:hypothetical protein
MIRLDDADLPPTFLLCLPPFFAFIISLLPIILSNDCDVGPEFSWARRA